MNVHRMAFNFAEVEHPDEDCEHTTNECGVCASCCQEAHRSQNGDQSGDRADAQQEAVHGLTPSTR